MTPGGLAESFPDHHREHAENIPFPDQEQREEVVPLSGPERLIFSQVKRRRMYLTGEEPKNPSNPVREYRDITKRRKVAPPILSYPYELLKSHLESRERRDLLKKVNLEEALDQERFDLMAGILEYSTPLERMYIRARAGAYPALFRSFNGTVRELLADGRNRSADNLVKAREHILGPLSVDDALRSELAAPRHEAIPVTERELVHNEGEEGVSSAEAMIGFYADEYARIVLQTLRSATDFNSRAPSSLRLGLARIDEAVTLRTQSLFRRTRRYLLYAVQTELQHQDEKGLAPFLPELDSIDTSDTQNKRKDLAALFRDREDVLNFLRMAESRFMTAYGSDTYYGGEPWARIAEVAYDAWKTDDLRESVPIIDRMFQLQHNTGTVLDKDRDEFSDLGAGTKQILDAKFAAATGGELLSNLQPFMRRKPKMTRTIVTRLTEINELLRTAKNYFPVEAQQASERFGVTQDLLESMEKARYEEETERLKIVKQLYPDIDEASATQVVERIYNDPAA